MTSEGKRKWVDLPARTLTVTTEVTRDQDVKRGIQLWHEGGSLSGDFLASTSIRPPHSD